MISQNVLPKGGRILKWIRRHRPGHRTITVDLTGWPKSVDPVLRERRAFDDGWVAGFDAGFLAAQGKHPHITKTEGEAWRNLSDEGKRSLINRGNAAWRESLQHLGGPAGG